MADLFSDLTSVVLAGTLDASSAKHRAIAENIANVETPGYIRKDVAFSDQLREALRESDPNNAMSRVRETLPEQVEDITTPMGQNANNVSIDKEMADLTKNSIEYESLTRLVSMKFAMLMNAISEGKK